MIDRAFQAIDLALIELLALTTLEIGYDDLLNSGPVFLTKKGGPCV